jgi:hypothetical protein
VRKAAVGRLVYLICLAWTVAMGALAGITLGCAYAGIVGLACVAGLWFYAVEMVLGRLLGR